MTTASATAASTPAPAARRHAVPAIAAAIAVGAAFTALVVAGLLRTRLWEDEAYNLSVPLNLALGRGYLSAGILNDGVPALFDPKVSTGPAVLAPIAPLIAAGVDPVTAGRLVGAAFALALAAGLLLFGRRIAGMWGGIAAVSALVLFTAADSASPIQGLTDVLGELPAAAFLVFAVLTLRRHPLAAGALIGLAFESKNLSVLAIPALVVGAVLSGDATRQRIRHVLLLAAGAAIPVAVFEMVRLVALGPGGYLTSVRALGRFLLSGGQSGFSSPWWEKAGAALAAWSLPAWVPAILLAAAMAVLVVARRSPLLGRALGRVRIELIVVASLFVLWTVWWWVSSSTPVWVRHPAPALVLAGAVVAALLVLAVRALAAGRRASRIASWSVAVALCLAVAGGAVVRLADVYDPRRESLAQQRATAEAIALDDGTDRVHGSWGPPVSIAFLQGKRLVLPGEGGGQDGVWTFPPGIDDLVAGGDAVGVESCADPVENRGYRSCLLRGVSG
ncbi:hypothetical protein [Herbiconiux sp. L3-i23]|uniref:hypothetical protein n=1 Tax=Herbiconiux sp. L3-i23 TaxID=2905871 RepID=UPI00206D4D66|nr:hypothetical protein [Herbiconiux sp. L3-i23]BDI21615.1 hypothetical protein L3i23_03910 [Herbiconiux sp. L3-i23]